MAGSRYSDIENLIPLPEFADRNFIFAFHYYSPHTFTHQGAPWGSAYWIGLHDVPFPGTGSSTAKAPTDQLNGNYCNINLTIGTRSGLPQKFSSRRTGELSTRAAFVR